MALDNYFYSIVSIQQLNIVSGSINKKMQITDSYILLETRNKGSRRTPHDTMVFSKYSSFEVEEYTNY